MPEWAQQFEKLKKLGGFAAGAPIIGHGDALAGNWAGGVQYLSSTAGSQSFSANSLVAR